jgi:hypothetical protein
VVLSFSKNEPVGRPKMAILKKSKNWFWCGIAVLKKNLKIGQRTNPELWFFGDCFRKPTMNLTCGVWWCPGNPRVVVILPSVTPKCALEQKRKRTKFKLFFFCLAKKFIAYIEIKVHWENNVGKLSLIF